MKKKLILPALVVVMGGAAALGASHTSAQTQTTTNEYPPVVQKLVTKFGLNESEVKAVFDEARTERAAEMKTKLEERLSQAVANGKISEEQKQKIITKLQELHQQRQTFHDQLKNMSPEERRAAMEKHRAELETWAQENGIDPSYLKMKHRGPGPRGS